MENQTKNGNLCSKLSTAPLAVAVARLLDNRLHWSRGFFIASKDCSKESNWLATLTNWNNMVLICGSVGDELRPLPSSSLDYAFTNTEGKPETVQRCFFTGPRCPWGPVYGSRFLYVSNGLCETLLMWLWLMMIPTQYDWWCQLKAIPCNS